MNTAAAVLLLAAVLQPAHRTAPLNFGNVSAPPRRAPSVTVEIPTREALSWTKTAANEIGYARPLPAPLEVRESRWSGTVRAAGAARVRLQLTNVTLPRDAKAWVYSERETYAIDFSLLDAQRAMWTPSVAGDRITLEIDAPSGGLTVQSVVIEPVAPQATECFTDATCYGESDFEGIGLARRAVAQLRYMNGFRAFLCTGTLINDRGDVDAYLLTANHCIDTEAEANSLEATWDWRTTGCNATTSAEVKTSGATLVATSPESDNTLLRMTSLPPDRVLLGWSTDPLADGTPLYRVSHPGGAPEGGAYKQIFAKSAVNATFVACPESPRPNFIYSTQTLRGAGPGSSGAALLLAGGLIVGDLRGPCGGNSSNGCDPANQLVDGSLAAGWPKFAQFLDNGPAVETCPESATTLCLSANRFAVSVVWKTGTGTGQGTAIPLSADTGYFWFFGSANIELMVKVLDARTVNGKFWVFYGALSNLEYTITVRDMETGKVKTYTNPAGNFGSVGDTSAF